MEPVHLDLPAIPPTPAATAPAMVQLAHRRELAKVLRELHADAGADDDPRLRSAISLVWSEIERVDSRLDRTLRRIQLPELPAGPAEIDPRLETGPESYPDGAICATVGDRVARMPLRRRPRFITTPGGAILRVLSWDGEQPVACGYDGIGKTPSRWLPLTKADLDRIDRPRGIDQRLAVGAWAAEWRSAGRAGWATLFTRWLLDLERVRRGELSLDDALGRYGQSVARLASKPDTRRSAEYRTPRGATLEEHRIHDRDRVRRWRARRMAVAAV